MKLTRWCQIAKLLSAKVIDDISLPILYIHKNMLASGSCGTPPRKKRKGARTTKGEKSLTNSCRVACEDCKNKPTITRRLFMVDSPIFPYSAMCDISKGDVDVTFGGRFGFWMFCRTREPHSFVPSQNWTTVTRLLGHMIRFEYTNFDSPSGTRWRENRENVHVPTNLFPSNRDFILNHLQWTQSWFVPHSNVSLHLEWSRKGQHGIVLCMQSLTSTLGVAQYTCTIEEHDNITSRKSL